MFRRGILILLLFTATNCFCQVSYKNYMDSLNIKELKQKIKVREEEYLKKRPERGYYPDDPYMSIGELEYFEVDSVTGDRFYIEGKIGNNEKTYKKTIIKKDDPIIIDIYYDVNGKVDGIGKTYSEHYFKKNPRAIEYPMGKYYSYGESGDVIKIVDYDSLYKYTIDDVFKFLKKNDISSLESIAQVGNAPRLAWEIWYRSSRYGRCEALIDAWTRKIIRDSKNIQSRED